MNFDLFYQAQNEKEMTNDQQCFKRLGRKVKRIPISEIIVKDYKNNRNDIYTIGKQGNIIEVHENINNDQKTPNSVDEMMNINYSLQLLYPAMPNYYCFNYGIPYLFSQTNDCSKQYPNQTIEDIDEQNIPNQTIDDIVEQKIPIQIEG